MLTREGSDFVAVPTDGHGTPAAAMSPGLVVKKKSTAGICAQPEAGPGTLGDQLRRGTSDGSEQPVQAAFAGHEFELPGTLPANQFVMTFGDSKDLVQRFSPMGRNFLLAVHRREYTMK